MSVRSRLGGLEVDRRRMRPWGPTMVRPIRSHPVADHTMQAHAYASRPCAAKGSRDRGRRPNASCSTETPRCRQASWSPSTREGCPVRARLGLPSWHRSARGGRFAAAPNRQVSVGCRWPKRFRVSCPRRKRRLGMFAWCSWTCLFLFLHADGIAGRGGGWRLDTAILYITVYLNSPRISGLPTSVDRHCN